MNIQSFPEPEDIKNKDEKYTLGLNKSGRQWKIGVNRKPNKNWRNPGSKLTWEQKKERKKQLDEIRTHLKDFKQKKILKRKQNKERSKQRKRQRQFNEVKSGKFEVIKNPKNMKKWSKKMKQQIVKLPAQVFQSIINK